MFWCNTGRQHSVETAQLDGSDHRTLAVDKVYVPYSLAVDLPVKRLYVVDMRMDSVHFCTYDGLQCHQVIAEVRCVVVFV